MDVVDVDSQLDRLETVVAELRATVSDVEIGLCDTAQLKRASVAVSTIRNMTDALKADIATRGAELRKAGNSKPVDDAVNPDGRKSPARNVPTVNTLGVRSSPHVGRRDTLR